MITEVSLVIICHHYGIVIFLAIRALKTYFLSNFQIVMIVNNIYILLLLYIIYILLPCCTLHTSPWLICFITRSLYLLIPFNHFSHLPNLPSLWQPPIYSVSVNFVLFCLLICFVFQMSHMSEIIWHLPYSVWFILLR